MPPELAGEQSETEIEEGTNESTLSQVREMFLRQQGRAQFREEVDSKLVETVFDYARSIVLHPSRPTEREISSFLRNPFNELAIEESLENSPFLDDIESLVVEDTHEKRMNCVSMLDASFSMAGEKHLLSSIAAAVLLLEIPPHQCGLIVFGNDAKVIRPLGARVDAALSIAELLSHRPHGYTNIAAALKLGLSQLESKRSGGRKIGVIATDGRSTEGEDPFPYARQYDYLAVLHVHGPGGHIDASQQLAGEGGGECFEVEHMQELPRRLYDALRRVYVRAA